MITTVIFDMDGLLIDSEPLWIESMQEVFQTVGIQISSELALQTTGLRTAEVISHWYRHFQWKGKSQQQVGDEIIDNMSAKLITKAGLMEGAIHLLSYFQQKDFKIGLASSSPLRFILHALYHFGLTSFFHAIQSAEKEPYGKPHPGVYLACAEALKTSPLQCVAFEDSVNGMIAAKAARMKLVIVPEPYNRSNLKLQLADLRLNSLMEFTDAHLSFLLEL